MRHIYWQCEERPTSPWWLLTNKLPTRHGLSLSLYLSDCLIASWSLYLYIYEHKIHTFLYIYNCFFLSFFFFWLQLKKSQELQKQRLFHTYQEQTKQMELEHKMQLEHKYHVSRRKDNDNDIESQITNHELCMYKYSRNQNETCKKNTKRISLLHPNLYTLAETCIQISTVDSYTSPINPTYAWGI